MTHVSFFNGKLSNYSRVKIFHFNFISICYNEIIVITFKSLAKLILLDKVLQAIKQDDLLENTRQAGDVLLNGLKELQNKFPQYLNSARGLGTFCAINCDSGAR